MPDDIGLVVKQMRQAGVMQPIVGGDGYDTPLLISVGGKAANDVYYSTHAYMATDSTPGDPEVLRRLQGRLRHRSGERLRRARLRHGRADRRCDQAGRRRRPGQDPRRDRRHRAATPAITGSISYPKDIRVPAKTVTMIGVKDEKLFLGGEVKPTYIAAP